jgi:signal transduction histidine kinase
VSLIARVPIRAKIYLVSIIAVAMLGLLAWIFLAVLSGQRVLLEEVESGKFAKVVALYQQFSMISRTHADLLDILHVQGGLLAEETLYVEAKPRLLDLNRIVEQMDEHRESLGFSAADAMIYDILIESAQAYLAAIVRTVEVASVEVDLVDRHMHDASEAFKSVETGFGTLMERTEKATSQAIAEARLGAADAKAIFGLIALATAIALLFCGWWLARAASRDLHSITGTMAALAAGERNVAVSGLDRGDEIGAMARATEAFRRNLELAEIERSENQAQRMEALGILAGGIAHEINTPVQFVGDNVRFLKDACAGLGGVLRACQALSAGAGDGSDRAAALQSLEQALAGADLDFLVEEIPPSIDQSLEGIDRIAEIVRAIKEFSHPDEADMTVSDINQMIETTVTVSRNQWKYVAEMALNLDHSLPPVVCRPGQINQVILNLIVNAAQAIEETGQQGRIDILTRRDGSWLEIAVSDSGCGIPEKNLEKIFEPFFTTKAVGKGTGQGLAISHSVITRKHGGTLSVDTAVGCGTTFTIRLPLEQSADSEAA